MCEWQRYPMTHVQTELSEFWHLLHRKNWNLLPDTQSFNAFQHRIQHYKAMMTTTFDVYSETALHTLMCHLLVYLKEDLYSFGSLELFNSSDYKHFCVHIKRAYRLISERCTTAFEEILSAIDMNIRIGKRERHKTWMTVRSAVSKTTSSNLHCTSTPSPKRLQKRLHCIGKGSQKSTFQETLKTWAHGCWHCLKPKPRKQSPGF